jgi:pyruvate formate lyase activating enzyme
MELAVEGCCGNCTKGGSKPGHACSGQGAPCEGKGKGGHHHEAAFRHALPKYPPVPIAGFTPLTLLDYPGKLASIAFLWGCNMRCGYCHNPGLVTQDDGTRVSEKEFLEFLDHRRGKLEGVVITGGEPCVHPGLPNFLSAIKEKGFAVKLDSNGSFPQVLKAVVGKGLVDYIAMDVKAPLAKYAIVSGSHVDSGKILESINFIKSSGIEHEFRTTVVPGIHAEEDLLEIGRLVCGADAYYLQQFRPGGNLDPAFERLPATPDSFLLQMAQKLESFASVVGVRGLSY